MSDNEEIVRLKELLQEEDRIIKEKDNEIGKYKERLRFRERPRANEK